MQLQALRIISLPSVNLNWSYNPENAQIGAKFGVKFVVTSLALTFCMDITFVDGNNSQKFHDYAITATLWKRFERRRDGWMGKRTDSSVLRAALSQLKADW